MRTTVLKRYGIGRRRTGDTGRTTTLLLIVLRTQYRRSGKIYKLLVKINQSGYSLNYNRAFEFLFRIII